MVHLKWNTCKHKEFHSLPPSSCNTYVIRVCAWYIEPCVEVLGVWVFKSCQYVCCLCCNYPDSKVHGGNMPPPPPPPPPRVMSAPDGPHVGPMNLAITVVYQDYYDDAKFSEPIQAANATPLAVRRIFMLLYETVRGICNINSECLNDIFVTKYSLSFHMPSNVIHKSYVNKSDIRFV